MSEPTICRYAQCSKADCDRAKAEGMEVVETNDTTLLLDLDDTLALHVFEVAFKRLADYCELSEAERWRSKSGKGTHVVIKSGCSLSFIERVALQSMLGSDPMREALHWAAIRRGDDPRIVLFKPAAAKEAA